MGWDRCNTGESTIYFLVESDRFVTSPMKLSFRCIKIADNFELISFCLMCQGARFNRTRCEREMFECKQQQLFL